MAPTALDSLPKGYQFSPTTFDLSPQWVGDYITAVEDSAIGAFVDLVPPMAVAALSVRALLEEASLPPGAIHLAQELAFCRAIERGEQLTARARVASRGERQGWVLMGVELALEDGDSLEVMTGRATLTCPIDPQAALPDVAGSNDRNNGPPSGDQPVIVRNLTQDKIERYAEASGDHNPLHVDSLFAEKTRFGGTIAHGMLLLAYISEMMTVAHGQAWLAGGRLKVRFRGAAKPGDTVAVANRMRSENGRGSYEVRCTNQKREVLISGEAEVAV
jgi:3-hydroxybutyryl-CoA dehydratase